MSGDDYSKPAHSKRLSIPRDTGAAGLVCCRGGGTLVSQCRARRSFGKNHSQKIGRGRFKACSTRIKEGEADGEVGQAGKAEGMG